jgi:Family of unknown function (DUF6166)
MGDTTGIYTGIRSGDGIARAFYTTADGGRTELNLRLDLSNHSPSGFEWGYGGSGPAQLALAILAHRLGDDERALALHQRFKFRVVGAFAYNGWTMGADAVDDVLDEFADEDAEADALAEDQRREAEEAARDREHDEELADAEVDRGE